MKDSDSQFPWLHDSQTPKGYTVGGKQPRERASMISYLDQFVGIRPVGPDKGGVPLEKFRFFKQLKSLFVKGQPTPEELSVLAGQLHRNFLRNQPFIEILKGFLRILSILNKTKNKVIGVDASAQPMNDLIAALAAQIAGSNEFGEREYDAIMRAANQAKEEELTAWFYPKYRTLANAVVKAMYARRYIDSLHGRVSPAMYEAREDKDPSQEYKQLADELMTAIRTLRGYEIKDSLFHDRTLCGKGEVMTIVSPQVYLHENPELDHMLQDAMAIIALAKSEEVESLKPVAVHELGPTIDDKWRLELVTTSYHSSFMCFIDDQGEIDLGGSLHQESLREFFEKKNLSHLYELVRLSLIARVYDMLIPAEIVDSLPSLDGLSLDEEELRVLSREDQEKMVKRIRALILPRIKIIREERQRIVDILEKERVGELEKRHHAKPLEDVTYIAHRVRLPRGSKPRPEAFELAKKHNPPISLIDPDGTTYTYRKGHTRPGLVSTPVIHEQKNRG